MSDPATSTRRIRVPVCRVPHQWRVHEDHVVATRDGWRLIASMTEDCGLSFVLRNACGWSVSVGLLEDHPYVEHPETAEERRVPDGIRRWAIVAARLVDTDFHRCLDDRPDEP